MINNWADRSFMSFPVQAELTTHLRTFALIVSTQHFCASYVSIACVSLRGPRKEKCHTKVCKQIWRPQRKVKKEVKVGDS